jgi:Arc/MetJ-type ribon-helix-helix transcriptional regulator
MKIRTTVARTRKNSTAKKKTSFSLSREAIDFLKSYVTAQHYNSSSEALDALLRGKRQELEKERIDASIAAYYDSLTDEERQEEAAWGKFAESQFPDE